MDFAKLTLLSLALVGFVIPRTGLHLSAGMKHVQIYCVGLSQGQRQLAIDARI